MSKITVFLAGILFVGSCRMSEEGSIHKPLGLEPKEYIRKILDSFVVSTGTNKAVYELYLNRTSPDECDWILYAGAESLIPEERRTGQVSVLNTKSAGITFNIYSGIEDYFLCFPE